MILKRLMDLKHSIKNHQKALYKMAKEQCLSDQEVLAISRQLNEEIVNLQKLINKGL